MLLNSYIYRTTVSLAHFLLRSRAKTQTQKDSTKTVSHSYAWLSSFSLWPFLSFMCFHEHHLGLLAIVMLSYIPLFVSSKASQFG